MFRRTHLMVMLAGCLSVGRSAWAEEPEIKKPAPKSVTKEPMTKPAPQEPELEQWSEELKRKATDKVVAGSRKKEPLYDLARLSPPLAIELRYATTRNLAGRAIYPRDARCLVRESVAARLVVAQDWLDAHAPTGTRLKIWDGYRPASAHRLLWKVLPNKEYLGDPKRLGSLHTWGVCVDATLCDAAGREFKMPTDFDVLTPAASTFYTGDDDDVKRHLGWLHGAMRAGGFLVVRDEWWHFVARDHAAFAPLDVPLALPQKR